MKSLFTALLLFTTFFAEAKNCTVQFDVKNSKIEGTGFKFTKKTGVTGRFTGFKINKQEKKKDFKSLLTGLVVTVDLMTLDSGNALRDRNMRETLFANILGDSVVLVEVLSVSKESINTNIKLNEKSLPVTFKYNRDSEFVIATGQIDLADFVMGQQISALKNRCGSLHTGSDGKSVTWTKFDLKISAMLKKNCVDNSKNSEKENK